MAVSVGRLEVDAVACRGTGRTVCEGVCGLRVINGVGSPARFVAGFVRNLVRVVDFLPGFYGFGLLCIVFASRSQRLGDLAAGTFVVRAPRPRVDWLALRTFEAGADRMVNARPVRTGGTSGPWVAGATTASDP